MNLQGCIQWLLSISPSTCKVNNPMSVDGRVPNDVRSLLSTVLTAELSTSSN